MQRQEHKFFVKREDVVLISNLLKPLMYLDRNCKNHKPYTITSIYFDSSQDEGLFDKLNGIRFREKYRIRYYNDARKKAKFEIKRKIEYSVEKLSIDLNFDEQNSILAGDYSCLKKHAEFEYIAYKMDFKCYKPKAVVRYDRLAFTLPFNNIRVTLDLNIRSTGFYSGHIEGSCLAGKLIMPVGYEVLEVKFLGEFPDYLKKLLSGFSLTRSSIGKYILARFYNNSELNGDNPILPF
jgi:SPX domain protein involved in polyphosphate accumulation